MRKQSLLFVAITLIAGALCAQATFEPQDQEQLEQFRKLGLASLGRVDWEHQVGDLKDAEVLDRGVYRTTRVQVLAKTDNTVLIEAHNGRGLCWAFEIDQSGTGVNSWVGVAGGKPERCKSANLMLDVDQLGEVGRPLTHLTESKQTPSYAMADTVFRLGSDAVPSTVWFIRAKGVHVQMTTTRIGREMAAPEGQGARMNRLGGLMEVRHEGVVTFRCTRITTLTKPEPAMDWSGTAFSDLPKAAAVAPWKAPDDGWTIERRSDGSLFVMPWGNRMELMDEAQTDMEQSGWQERYLVFRERPFVLQPGTRLQHVPNPISCGTKRQSITSDCSKRSCATTTC